MPIGHSAWGPPAWEDTLLLMRSHSLLQESVGSSQRHLRAGQTQPQELPFPCPLFFKLMTSSTNNWVLIKIIKLVGVLLACPTHCQRVSGCPW